MDCDGLNSSDHFFQRAGVMNSWDVLFRQLLTPAMRNATAAKRLIFFKMRSRTAWFAAAGVCCTTPSGRKGGKPSGIPKKSLSSLYNLMIFNNLMFFISYVDFVDAVVRSKETFKIEI